MDQYEPRDASLTIRLPSKLKDELVRIRRRDNVSIADIVVPLLPGLLAGYEQRRYLKRHQRDAQAIGKRQR